MSEVPLYRRWGAECKKWRECPGHSRAFTYRDVTYRDGSPRGANMHGGAHLRVIGGVARDMVTETRLESGRRSLRSPRGTP